MKDFQILSRRQVEFGIWIRNYRRAHELSQTEFAHIATCYGGNVSAVDISNFENFRYVPSESKMFAILHAMQIELEDLD